VEHGESGDNEDDNDDNDDDEGDDEALALQQRIAALQAQIEDMSGDDEDLDEEELLADVADCPLTSSLDGSNPFA